MPAPPDDTIADLHADIATLQAERDAALAEKAGLTEALVARTTELATRNSEYGERIEQQAATLDVLKAMSASPGDAQPVFELIARRALEFCGAAGARLVEFDGSIRHLRALVRIDDMETEADEAVRRLYPSPPDDVSIDGRVILSGATVHVRDTSEVPSRMRGRYSASVVGVPLLRHGQVAGAIVLARPQPGGFSETQIELLKTFAEQAVIAIGSAGTYRALQTRTADLQESLEYQTATSDVLKAISRSAFDLQPVLETLLRTAAQLCDADTAGMTSRDGDAYRVVATYSNTPAFDTFIQNQSFVASRASVTGRTVLEGQIVHIADLAADPEYAVTEALTLGGVRTLLGVPLLREGGVAGVIILGRFRVQPFTHRQIELVSTFADQAGIAIENTRLLTEQHEALEQQTATAEVLQVINASPGNLTPVFEAMLGKATGLCSAAFGILWRFDGKLAWPEALHQVPAGFAEFFREPRQPSPESGPGRMMRGENAQAFPDIAELPLYAADDPMTRAIVDLAGARSSMIAPLRKDGVTLGAITIYRQEVRPFTDKQIALLQNFAAQAVIAMENARLITETREALEQQTATAEVLQVINSSPGDLAPVFDAMLEKAVRLCGGIRGVLWTINGEHARLAASRGLPTEFVTLLRAHGEHGTNPMLQRVIHGEHLFQFNVSEHELYRSGDPLAKAAFTAGVRTLIWVALVKDGESVGAFAIGRGELRPFSDKEIALLQNFAAQAVIAMENARLITETREALEQQTATAEVLQVINSSPGELAPVFDSMLEKATRLCEADFGILWNFDGELAKAGALHRVPAAYAEMIRAPFHPSPESGPARMMRGERTFVVADLREFPPYHAGDALVRAIVHLAGARSVVISPLRKDAVTLGAITIYRQEVRPFTDKQIALLQNFAAQAVIAMENARLITETREALEQQTATAEVLQVINESPGNLASVFEAILDKAHSLCGAVVGSLLVYDGEHFRAEATHGQPDEVSAILVRPFAPNIFLQRLVFGEHLVHIPDFKAASVGADHELTRGTRDSTGIRTSLWVPLRKDGVLLGCISAFRLEVRPFSEKEIALLENFAAQAVIAMENARLLTEQREALEQQTATAEVLQVINASPGELTPVFDVMLEKATALCEAAFGTLLTYDGERFIPVAAHGVPPAFADFRSERGAFAAPSGSSLERVVTGENLVHIANVATDPGQAATPLVELGGCRTLVCVALRKDQTLVGAITVYRQEVRPFTDKQIALLQNFAVQAVIAMENARLITEQREALEQQTATAEVLQAINASPGNLQPVFDAILEKAHLLCGIAAGSLEIYDGERIQAVAVRGMSDSFSDQLRSGYPAADSPATRPLLAGERISHILNAAAVDYPVFRSAAAQEHIGTVLFVPLRRDNTLLGMIASARREVRPFSEKEIALLENFAAQAVIAIENARLLDELQARTAALAQRNSEYGERIEQQSATIDVLKVMSASLGDARPVFELIVERATAFCEADGGGVALLDGDMLHLQAYLNHPNPGAYEASFPQPISAATMFGRAILARDAVQMADSRTDANYGLQSALGDEARSMVGVPLLRAGTPIGAISLVRRRLGEFSATQVELLRTFAEQAVIAISSAETFRELQSRTAELRRSVEELQLLSEVGRAVSSTLDLRAVLSTVLTRSVGLTGADAGAIFRYGLGDRSFRLVEAFGWDTPLLRSVGDMRIPEDETALGEAAAQRTPIELTDLAERPSTQLRDASLAAGFRAVLIVPLVGPERILGALVLQRRAAGDFPPETVRLMQALASQSVLAIQNARLYREIADKSEQLALASQHKSQFLANMSHELRTPLNAILGYAELLVDGIYGDMAERPKGVLERIQDNGKHLLALINDVLDLAKIEAGQLTLNLNDYNMPDLVRSVVTATEPLAAAKGLQFAAVLDDGLPTAHGDARRVSQVLLNLVGNAIKFTEAGEVEIRASAEAGSFVLSVRDTGPGIAEADQERIFGEFQQIDNSSTRKQGGSGLGLAIARRIVEMQGGTISVTSTLGEGSTFRVVLPVKVEAMLEAA